MPPFSHEQLPISQVTASITAKTPPTDGIVHKSLQDIIERTNDLTEEQKDQLLLSYSDIFPKDDHDYGHTNLVHHSINTGDAAPKKHPYRRIPQHLQQETTQLVQSMLDNNVIERSSSPWSSPVILVKKEGWIDSILCRLQTYQ